MNGPLSPITEEEIAAVAARLRSCRVTVAVGTLTLTPYPDDYCPAFARWPSPCPLTPAACTTRHIHHAREEDGR